MRQIKISRQAKTHLMHGHNNTLKCWDDQKQFSPMMQI